MEQGCDWVSDAAAAADRRTRKKHDAHNKQRGYERSKRKTRNTHTQYISLHISLPNFISFTLLTLLLHLFYSFEHVLADQRQESASISSATITPGRGKKQKLTHTVRPDTSTHPKRIGRDSIDFVRLCVCVSERLCAQDEF